MKKIHDKFHAYLKKNNAGNNSILIYKSYDMNAN